MQALRTPCRPFAPAQPANKQRLAKGRPFVASKRDITRTVCQAAAAPHGQEAPERAKSNDKSDSKRLPSISQQQLVVGLQRLALEAQAEKDMWEAHLSEYELQQQQLRAHLDARARHHAHCRDALATLRHLLQTARHVAREQHLAVFAESVHHCGRQRLRLERQEERDQHQIFVRATAEAAEQLQHYEATLTGMVSHVMASMATAESLPLSLPALITGETVEEQLAGKPQAATPVVAAGVNNIVPAKAPVAALLRQQQEQRRQRRAARSASPALI